MGTLIEAVVALHKPAGVYTLRGLASRCYMAGTRDRIRLARWATKNGFIILWDEETALPVPGDLRQPEREGF